MAIVFDAPVTPDALSTFVREMPMPANLALSQAFPEREVQSNRVDLAEIVHTNRTATFRPFDGRIGTMPRDSGSLSEVNLLPLSNSLSMGEFERLSLEFARTAGTAVEALANAIYNDAQNLVQSVRNRIEVAWGDVLTDGKLTINEGGFQGEADFGVPDENFVNAAASWSDPNTKILSDIFAWQDAQVLLYGYGAETIRTSLKQVRNMQTNKEIINAVFGAQTGKTRVTRTELNDLLASEGLPTLAPPYDLRLDVQGQTKRILPDDKVILTPANLSDLGFTAYGISATALELVSANESDLTFSDAPGIVGVVEKDGPPYRSFTFVDAVAMPILAQPRRLFVASV